MDEPVTRDPRLNYFDFEQNGNTVTIFQYVPTILCMQSLSLSFFFFFWHEALVRKAGQDSEASIFRRPLLTLSIVS